MFKKESKIPIYLFIITSLVALAFFLVFCLIFLSNIRYQQLKEDEKTLVKANNDAKMYLNEEFDERDPYITKVPRLKDIIRGPIITDLDPSTGNINSDVTLVLFSDFECSYCSKQEKILDELVDKYDLRLVWKDYPTSNPESRSYQAAVAARCAQLENAFWQYHDLLYENKEDLSKDNLFAIAEEIHLDTDEFKKCLNEMSTEQLVYDNMLEADALGIDGVPFLYINDREVLGEASFEELEKLIELELTQD